MLGLSEGRLEMSTKLYTSKTWMRRKYVVEKLTEEEIAKLANTTQATVNRWLTKFDLKKKRR